MFQHDPPNQLHHLDKSSPTFHDQISNVLNGKEYRQWVSGLQGDLVGFVGHLDQVRHPVPLVPSPLKSPQSVDVLDPASSAFPIYLHELRHPCDDRRVLPASYAFSSRLLDVGPRPATPGGSGDVYEGTLNGSKVYVKRAKTHPEHNSACPKKVSHPAAFPDSRY